MLDRIGEKLHTQHILFSFSPGRKDVVVLKKQLSAAETDFVYLSSPAQLKQYLIVLKKKDYSTYDYSKIFHSTNQFLSQSLKETKLIKKTLHEGR